MGIVCIFLHIEMKFEVEEKKLKWKYYNQTYNLSNIESWTVKRTPRYGT